MLNPQLFARFAVPRRFTTNFRYWSGVRFPKPAGARLVSSDVLVETFEEGELITRYMNAETPGRYNKKLAGVCLHGCGVQGPRGYSGPCLSSLRFDLLRVPSCWQRAAHSTFICPTLHLCSIVPPKNFTAAS
jgi:hypothetical protein